MSNNYFEKISNDFLSKKYGSKHKEKKLEPRSTVHIPKALSSMLGETKERGPSWGGGHRSRHVTNLKEEIITNTNVSFQHLTSQNKSVSI